MFFPLFLNSVILFVGLSQKKYGVSEKIARLNHIVVVLKLNYTKNVWMPLL